MKVFKFRSPIWIALYLVIIPNLAWFSSIPIVISLFYWERGLDSLIKLSTIGLLMTLLPISLIVILPMYITESVTIKHNGFRVSYFGQLDGFANWDEINKVEPYRYYGLSFFLVWFNELEFPLWLPLFLDEQNKLNRVIIESTKEDNPLNIALLQKDNLLQKLPWHSRKKPA